MTDVPEAAVRATTEAELTGELEALEDDLNRSVDEVLARAVEIKRAAEALGGDALILRARLLEADIWGRTGGITDAAKVLWEINKWATAHDHRPLRMRTHRLLARTYFTLGDLPACLDHAVFAMELLDDDAPPVKRAVYLMVLASALSQNGSYDAARDRFQQAERMAVASGDAQRLLTVLNNFACSEYLAGEPQRAWVIVERLRAVAEAHHKPLTTTALDTIALVLIALGRYAEAAQAAQASIDVFASLVDVEAGSLAEALLTLAVAQRHLGAADAAQTTLDRCGVVCRDQGLAEVRVRLLQEQAELHAARGNLGLAFATYKEFHAADKELVSQRREAQARAHQATFETAEAQQEAKRFREQARRDPLTGLHNRRHVDEQLPGLIEQSAETGAPVVAALIDLDHFKRVNDSYSHEVGDEVLVAVAGLLAAAIPAAVETRGGFLARMGGEEFLLVLTGMSLAEAVACVEEARRAVADHPWQAIVGELAVTVSIGLTTAEPYSTQSHLLARADKSLYTAKRSGRNRVCVDPEINLGRGRHYRDAPPPVGTG
jgi:diguanylate cyclase (GGDEF)-like protein